MAGSDSDDNQPAPPPPIHHLPSTRSPPPPLPSPLHLPIFNQEKIGPFGPSRRRIAGSAVGEAGSGVCETGNAGFTGCGRRRRQRRSGLGHQALAIAEEEEEVVEAPVEVRAYVEPPEEARP